MTRRISKPRRDRVRTWAEAYKAEVARPGTAMQAKLARVLDEARRRLPGGEVHMTRESARHWTQEPKR